jgi:hypothetical protein
MGKVITLEIGAIDTDIDYLCSQSEKGVENS